MFPAFSQKLDHICWAKKLFSSSECKSGRPIILFHTLALLYVFTESYDSFLGTLQLICYLAELFASFSFGTLDRSLLVDTIVQISKPRKTTPNSPAKPLPAPDMVAGVLDTDLTPETNAFSPKERADTLDFGMLFDQ